MNVAAILRQKGRSVTTASPAMTVLEVAEKLFAKRIGAKFPAGANVVRLRRTLKLERRLVPRATALAFCSDCDCERQSG